VLRVTSRHPQLAPLARVALLVAIGDYITKDAAVRWVAHEPAALSGWLRLAIIHNEGGAFGWSLGAYTWHVNLAVTIAAIAFVVAVSRDLSRVDRRAPLALGLIVGGATGNLASLILSPRGVVDFIAVDFTATTGIILNVADVAAYVGLALVLRTGFLIVAAMRRELRPSARAVRQASEVLVASPSEREVARPVFREPSAGAAMDVPQDPRPEITRPLSIDAAIVHVPARVLDFPVARTNSHGLSTQFARAAETLRGHRVR
jgi:lipoprotein signal peptidase